jgi:hypothetical protein
MVLVVHLAATGRGQEEVVQKDTNEVSQEPELGPRLGQVWQDVSIEQVLDRGGRRSRLPGSWRAAIAGAPHEDRNGLTPVANRRCVLLCGVEQAAERRNVRPLARALHHATYCVQIHDTIGVE